MFRLENGENGSYAIHHEIQLQRLFFCAWLTFRGMGIGHTSYYAQYTENKLIFGSDENIRLHFTKNISYFENMYENSKKCSF